MRPAIVMVLALCLLDLGTTSAFAQLNVTPTRMAEYDATSISLPPAATGCAIGSRGPAVGFSAFNGSGITGAYEAIIVSPQQHCPQCLIGFDVASFHLLMRIDRTCALYMDVVFLQGAPLPRPWALAPDCSVGSIVVVQFPESGIYDVEIPLACPCAASMLGYALIIGGWSSVCMPTEGEPVPGTVELGYSAVLTPGRNWHGLSASNSWWEWWPGDMVWYAEASCCEPAVPVGADSWGAMKGRFQPAGQ